MNESGTAVMAQTLLWLMVIIALILALAWAARRFSTLSAFGGQGMKVISALPVGNRERVVLVQVGDKQMLLGVAPGNVSMLHAFDQPVLNAAPGLTSQAQSAGFQTVLKTVMNRKS